MPLVKCKYFPPQTEPSLRGLIRRAITPRNLQERASKDRTNHALQFRPAAIHNRK